MHYFSRKGGVLVYKDNESVIDSLESVARNGTALIGIDLHNVNALHITQTQTHINGVHGTRMVASGADLRCLNMRQSYLVQCSFKLADLRCADFSGATIYECNFIGANLTGAVFENAKIERCDFTDAIGFVPHVTAPGAWDETVYASLCAMGFDLDTMSDARISELVLSLVCGTTFASERGRV